MWRTTSGGRSSKVATIQSDSFIGAHLLSAHFATARVGWVAPESMDSSPPATGPLFETRDGGNQWTVDESGLISGLIGFPSAKKGYAYEPALDKPAYSGLSTDLKYFPLITDDGGGSWYHVKSSSPKGF